MLGLEIGADDYVAKPFSPRELAARVKVVLRRFDYFNFDAPGNSSDLWSIGAWTWYDFTPAVGLALRADYIGSPDGVLGPAVRPGAGITTTDSDGDLGSVTLTLNWKPVPNIKVQPELRYDYTSYKNGLNGDRAA